MPDAMELGEFFDQIGKDCDTAFRYRGWTLQNLSVTNINPLGKVHYITVTGSGDITASLRVFATIFNAAVAAGNKLAKGNRIDIVIDQVKVSKKFGLDIIPLSIQENGISAAEKLRRLTREKCADLGIAKRTQALPPFVQKIALVTIQGGSINNDLLHRSGLRPQRMLEFRFNPALVGSFRQQIEKIPGDVDLIVIYRGGKADAGMEFFDTLEAIEAIQATPAFVATGIGHQDEHTLLDDFADANWNTPSGAGDKIKSINRSFIDTIQTHCKAIDEHGLCAVRRIRSDNIDSLSATIGGSTDSILRRIKTDDINSRAARIRDSSRAAIGKLKEDQIFREICRLCGSLKSKVKESRLSRMQQSYQSILSLYRETLRTIRHGISLDKNAIEQLTLKISNHVSAAQEAKRAAKDRLRFSVALGIILVLVVLLLVALLLF
ncbi:exodeoxyribonuclease VII large subunit [Geoalkalibacter sp.]|uniref:exodeoxyribonuclease VII large subunit n=1 Tax=Geoalkalibacter sp. TaxID=3041440 RepID=UPI00272E2E6D|nr:exodeoxyribonuclease VII large subunit [Geoalkalibacter sp.]